MSSAFMVIIGTIITTTNIRNHNSTSNGIYYEFPKFWANTGFCPAGNINNRYEIKDSLLSDAVQMNLKYIAALPAEACSHVRIHWLLELLEFVEFTQEQIPIYDFTDLDEFLENLNDVGLQPVIEFMANPGDVFIKNPTFNDVLWQDFSFQVAKHYLNRFGAKTLLKWRFETWNEPDLRTYNRLNFTTEDYLIYVYSIRHGLEAAGRRPENSLHFPLRGPAGLFKSEDKHPLCWRILEQCNENINQCPLETLTYHRKGDGVGAIKLLNDSSDLLKDIYRKYPTLRSLPISNDEADPIADWSTPREFQEDVRYAHTLVLIVLMHWSAKLKRKEFKNLETISHDNAFLSYHPYEFSQRTLLAHFRMNDTDPVHSQFIIKPVYAALGMLAKLSSYASDLETVTTDNGTEFHLLRTTAVIKTPNYLSYLILPTENCSNPESFSAQIQLPLKGVEADSFYFIIELLDNELTNPVYTWRQFNSPAYPDPKIREQMRRNQMPLILAAGILEKPEITLNNDLMSLSSVWIMLFRTCSERMPKLKPPTTLMATQITQNEVFLNWFEVTNNTQCLKTYEVWFQSNESTDEWIYISKTWHLPFPSFHYAPNSSTNGFYKVRGLDIFDRYSDFSEIIEYIDI